MAVAAWTLEGELCAIAGDDNLPSALSRLSLIEDAAAPFDLVTTRDWYRSGAETYVLLFEIRRHAGVRAFVVKACVAYVPGQSLTETVAEWVARRRLVSGLGVSTPELVGVNGADIVEEFIPHDLFDALSIADSSRRVELLRNLGRTAGLLVHAGFAPLSTHDWRSRGTDVVLVDFGQDLGPAKIAPGSESGLLSELTDRLSKLTRDLAPNEWQVLVSAYETAFMD